jgi:molybdenum cofactor cytidylyltransferase
MQSETTKRLADGDALLFSRALRLVPPFDFRKGMTIAFTGAGGKTTALFELAHQLPLPVLITTTTHLGAWQIPLADYHLVAQNVTDITDGEFHGITLITGPVQDHRATSLNQNTLSWLHTHIQNKNAPMLIEADGARQMALKAPGNHEPVIPAFTDVVIVVAGLGGLGKPLNEDYVYRPQLFSALCGLPLNDFITTDALVRSLTHPNGGLKNIPHDACRIILLNQADTPELQSIGGKMAISLLDHFDSVIVGSFHNMQFHTFERTAGIVLAAGASTRFGQPKQLLDWHGEPFVRVAAQIALKAGLSPVIVVTGANADAVESKINDLPVTIARNDHWQSGQATSIRVGIQSLPGSTGAVIFLLADQPQIKTDVIQALVEHHAIEFSPIIAPLVMLEQRANPVLFDRVTFPDLLKLKGDIGGRALFSKYPVEYLPWHDDRLLIDVDNPEDYQRLIDDDTL